MWHTEHEIGPMDTNGSKDGTVFNQRVELVTRSNRKKNVSQSPCGELSLVIIQFLKGRDPVLVQVSH